MRLDYRVLIHFDNIQTYEPFSALEIRAVRIVDGQCQWVAFDDFHAEFFSVYGIAKWDQRAMCIADCLDLETARNVADAFNTFAANSLIIHEHSTI